MADAASAEQEPPDLDRERARVEHWLHTVYRRQGFDWGQAQRLIDARVDHHRVEAALNRGCTLEVALRIFL